jgi:acyl dehydratase
VTGDVAELDSWRGRTATIEAPFPIEAGRVADFCAMLEDDNPVYWDEHLAMRRFGGRVAPPAMLTAWRFLTPWTPGGRPPHGPPLGCEVPLPVDSLINVGFSSEFDAPLLVGDRLTYRDTVSAISDRKSTGLGTGWFVTTDTVVTNQHGATIGRYRNVMFRFRPLADRQDTAVERAPAATPDSFTDALPDVGMPITATLCAQLTAATRDYFPGHHDGSFARAQGVQDAYPNTGFYCGLADLVATRWADGPVRVASRDLRMVRPAPIGETLRTGGEVLTADPVHRDRIDLHVDIVGDSGPVAAAEISLEMGQR